MYCDHPYHHPHPTTTKEESNLTLQQDTNTHTPEQGSACKSCSWRGTSPPSVQHKQQSDPPLCSLSQRKPRLRVRPTLHKCPQWSCVPSDLRHPVGRQCWKLRRDWCGTLSLSRGTSQGWLTWLPCPWYPHAEFPGWPSQSVALTQPLCGCAGERLLHCCTNKHAR